MTKGFTIYNSTKMKEWSTKHVLQTTEQVRESLLDMTVCIDDKLIEKTAESLSVLSERLCTEIVRRERWQEEVYALRAQVEEMKTFVGRRAAIKATKARVA